ncbi:uncharacterized protein G2W53_044082 [Senna tora]|uniref:Uncharacterized protein n=1 Tax=Senna tora TaxID=362788 RepID=A0A834SKC0_9FABA|nr:uncharacterized protein G2W53_044082 [Senna tora]
MRRLGMKGAWFGEVEGIGDEAILEMRMMMMAHFLQIQRSSEREGNTQATIAPLLYPKL